MNNGEKIRVNEGIYYRLIALWAFCEVFAGGLLHAFKIPFTGMLINSLSVTCIIFIAKYHRASNAIIKATIIVAIFKMMLSPHSPPTAYIAVFFQGLLGQLLFTSNRFFVVSGVLLGALTLVESSIQRILVLVIVYGNEFWSAFDVFINKLIGESASTSYSLVIAGTYVAIHLIVGLLVGFYAASIANRSVHWAEKYPHLYFDVQVNQTLGDRKKKKKRRWILIVIWSVLILLYLQSIFYPASSILPSKSVLMIFIRAALILLSWYLIFRPLFQKWIQSMLQKQQVKFAAQIERVTLLLPWIKSLFLHSRQQVASLKGIKKIPLFIKVLMVNILRNE